MKSKFLLQTICYHQLNIQSSKSQQISDKIGFSTVQSFSKAFKKANGVSPGVYRKRRLGLGMNKLNI
ncbi:hypothetical protein EfmAA610_30070 (plasmid) [Enterococcus faecium]|nr:hypothetical protein EfmAA610_30070 [Enterococcus faecium]